MASKTIMKNLNKMTNDELISQIDFIVDWATSAPSAIKGELYDHKTEYENELKSRYIDNKFSKWLVY